MRGSPGLPTRRCRRIMLESASPIALADYANLAECMPWSNRDLNFKFFSDALDL